jgi:hypothetical protein
MDIGNFMEPAQLDQASLTPDTHPTSTSVELIGHFALTQITEANFFKYTKCFLPFQQKSPKDASYFHRISQ